MRGPLFSLSLRERVGVRVKNKKGSQMAAFYVRLSLTPAD